MKRPYQTALVVILAFLLCFAGCGKKESKNNSSSQTSKVTSKAVTGSTTLSLPCVSNKSFNPYTTDSMTNLELWPLFYDCLAEPDQNFNPVLRLASAVSSQNNVFTVTLRSGVVFSDGSPLTAADVKYSFELAMGNTGGYFYPRVSNIANIETSGNDIIFNLKTSDPLLTNLLNLPILKQETGTSDTPTGSGIYKLASSGTDVITLTANSLWYKKTTPNLKTIRLVNIPDKNALMSSLEIGNIDFLHSDYGSGMQSSVNVSSKPVSMNQLIFIGVNSTRSPLNNVHLRKAVSYAVNRDSLVTEIYSGRTLSSILPLYPNLTGLKSTDKSKLKSDSDSFKNELKSFGSTSSLDLALLVNQDNSVRALAADYLVSNLRKAGLNISVEKVTSQVYNSRITSGNFDLYLGEVKLRSDMDLSSFLQSGGSSYGIGQKTATLTAYNNWRNGNGTLDAFAAAFENEMPFIPLCYKTGAVSYHTGLSGVVSTDGNLFYNIETWHF
ncbi:MAG TPA: ABC transporter substrate-binding protein [Clostridia bacterium]|nr:ABC transporter substrate-binding protein [Clostridia bacterium]